MQVAYLYSGPGTARIFTNQPPSILFCPRQHKQVASSHHPLGHAVCQITVLRSCFPSMSFEFGHSMLAPKPSAQSTRLRPCPSDHLPATHVVIAWLCFCALVDANDRAMLKRFASQLVDKHPTNDGSPPLPNSPTLNRSHCHEPKRALGPIPRARDRRPSMTIRLGLGLALCECRVVVVDSDSR